jgi:hypothetical protein
MKNLVLAIVVFIGATTSTLAQSEATLQRMYIKFLKEKGYETSIDDDGDVNFVYDDRTYFIEVNEDDLEFFRLVLPNIWPIESELEEIEVFEACNKANYKVKTAKAYATDDDVWIATEVFLRQPEDFEAIFERSLEVIDYCVDVFVEAMEE